MLVGINGFKGVGKDTVGQYLVEEYGFERLSFAAKLKESASALFDVNSIFWEVWKNNNDARIKIVDSDHEEDEPVVNISVREFLQRYGTEAHRDIFGTDFWVDHALKGVDSNKDFVFTDARFENELQRIKSLGGYNVRITRSELDSFDTHASEIAPPIYLVDYSIENNGTMEELYERVDEFVKFLEIESYAY